MYKLKFSDQIKRMCYLNGWYFTKATQFNKMVKRGLLISSSQFIITLING